MNEIRVHNTNIKNLLMYCFLTTIFVTGCMYMLISIWVNYSEITLGLVLFTSIGLPMMLMLSNRFVYYIVGSYYSLSMHDNIIVYDIFKYIHVEFLVSEIEEVKYFKEPTIEPATNDYSKEKCKSSELILIVRKGLKRSILISQKNVSSVEFLKLKEHLLKIRGAKQRIYKSSYYSTLIYGTKF